MGGLCQVCTGCITNHSGLRRDEIGAAIGVFDFNAHKTLDSLISSAKALCVICTLLWGVISLDDADLLKDFVPGEGVFTNIQISLLNSKIKFPGMSEDTWTLWASVKCRPLSWSDHERGVVFWFEPEQVAVPFYNTIGGSNSTASTPTWQLAMQWANECATSHTNCRDNKTQHWFPTRLIDVSGADKSLVRLIETSEAVICGEYLTLSHCWGTSRIFKLTRNTVRRLKKGIEVIDLPLTFQHAIEVTRRLQKRYIWIDSLCIYQDEDDKSDWLVEAQQMHEVYRNCYLNIAATWAKDSQQGMFSPRSACLELEPCRVEWCPPSQDTSRHAPQLRKYAIAEWNLLRRELANAPLNRRGWVLQERLLAPRILHFGKGQLFWECNKGVVCERFPVGLPPWMRRQSVSTFSNLDYSYGDPVENHEITDYMEPKEVDLQAACEVWKNMGEAYSVSKLTCSTDKLIAFAGIAKLMEQRLQDEYVLGMWKRRLAGQLVWKVHETSQADSKPSKRIEPKCAPTWSWLSLDAEVFLSMYREEHCLFKVLHVELQQTHSPDTGLTCLGVLRLKGRLRPLQLRSDAKEHSGVWTMNVGGKDLISPGSNRSRVDVMLDVPHEDFETCNKAQTLFVMSAWEPQPSNPDDMWHDMFILQCVDKDKGLFRRLGLAELNTSDEEPENFDYIKELDDCEADLPCESYVAEEHSHIIRLE